MENLKQMVITMIGIIVLGLMVMRVMSVDAAMISVILIFIWLDLQNAL